MISFTQRLALGEEPRWKEERYHESGGSRTYCNRPVSFQLLPRGGNGELQWQVLAIEGSETFRVIVAKPYVAESPALDITVEVDTVGIQRYPLPAELGEERYRYTVQVVCNPADPSHNVVASGFIQADRLISSDRTSVTIPGT
ncbi:MAG: hypothetical protein AAFY11_05220 [Cyanobacteria bacterium J06641_5]